MKMFNRVNFLRYLFVCVLVCVGVNAYGSWLHGSHSSTITVKANPTGKGTVYVSESRTATTGGTSNTWECGGSSDNDNKTWYLYATANDGHYFTGWSTSETGTVASNSATNPYPTGSISAKTSSYTYWAHFPAVTVNSVTPASVALTPTALRTAYPTDEISFASTGGDVLGDFNISDPNNGWAFADGYPKMSGSNVLVKLTYTAERDKYTNNAGTRTDASSVTVTSKGDTSSKQTVNLSATFGMTIAAPSSVTPLTITYPDTEVSGTVVFAVTGVEAASDVNVTIVPPEGSAETWTASVTNFDEETGKVTVTYTCTAGASSTRGTKTAAITLSSNYADAPARASCDVTATIKTTIEAGVIDDIVTTPDVFTIEGYAAVFDVAYATGTADFVLPPTLTSSKGTWSLGTPTYKEGEFPKGTLTIPYTFTHAGTVGDYTATLTLQTLDGDSEAVELKAIVEPPAAYDATVTTAAGVTTEYEKWADALAAANKADGSTITIARNIDLNVSGKAATQTVSKTMTIDLNGKTLSGTLISVTRLIYLNTAGKTLTIKDSRTGGKISVTTADDASRYAVQIAKGNLVLESGAIEMTSSNTSGTERNITGVYLSGAGTTFTMNGGTIHADHSAGKGARGVYGEKGTTTTLNAGTVQATAKTICYAVIAGSSSTAPSQITLGNATLKATATSSAYGIYSYGNVDITGGNIEVETKEINGTAGAGTANGIYMTAVSSGTLTSCYYGELNMTGGTVRATAATGTSYGIYLTATDGNTATNAPDGTHSHKSSAVGTIKNATIYATSLTSTNAYGIRINGNYNSLTNAYSNTIVENVTIHAQAFQSAYGIYADANISTTHGNKRQSSVEINNCNITAHATNTNIDKNQGTQHGYAYGVYVDAVQATITAANDWTGEEYATASSAEINGGTITATSAGSYAYAVYSPTRVITLKGNAEAYADIKINGGRFTAESEKYYAYGICSGGNTVIEDAVITAQSKTSSNARAAYVSSGTFEATDATFRGTAYTGTARGVEVIAGINSHTMHAYRGEAVLTNITASAVAETTSNAIALYLPGTTRTQTQATWDALSTSNKTTYPYYGEGDPNNIYVMGEKLVAPKATVQGGTYTARGNTTNVHGICSYNIDQTNGYTVSSTGKASGGTELTVRGATVEAISETSTGVYGLRVNGPTVIDNCNITATAVANTTAYGVYIFDNKTKLTNSTITTSATTTAYGVYVYAAVSNTAGYAGWKFAGELESEKNKITVTTTTGATARGLYVGAAQATTTATPAWNLSNGQFACAASATSVNDTYTVRSETSDARAIYSSTRVITNGGKAEAYPQLVVSNPKVTVTSGTSSAYGIEAGGNTILDGGMFTVRAITTTAVGAKAPSGTFKATNTKFDVTAEGSTSAENASVYAYGIYGDAAVDAYYMNARYGTFELNNVTADVTTATGNIAYGVYMTGAQREQVQATYDALTEANKTKYPYYGEGDERNIYVMGAKAVFPKVTINGGTYTATAKYNTAVGIRMHDNPMISTYATATAGGELSVKNATISATTQTTTTAYGIHANGLTEIDNCKITATTKTTTARGVSVYANKTKITNSTITAEGTSTVYGVYLYAQVSNGKGYAGWKYVAELESENNTVTATANNGDAAYGLWLHGHATTTTAVPDAGDPAFPLGDYACAASATLTNDSYTALASGKTAYAVGIQAEQIKNTVSAAPTCTINGGKYWGEAPTTFADIHPNGLKGNVLIKDGYFLNNTNVDKYIENGKAVLTLPSTTTEYKEGYRYYLGNAAAPGIGVCKIGNTQYKTLEEALQVVTSGQTIIMLNSYTLPAGNYVLPTGASLLVPCNVSHTSLKKTNVTRKETYVKPSAYMTLTFAEGVNFTLQGNLEIGGEMNAQQGESKVGAVCGTYGHLYLENNARIDVESGAYVYAWGYVTGDGLINVKKGGTAYESFQIGDFKGGTNTTGMNNNRYDVFPVTHYFYQNIEAGIIYRAGAHAYGSSAVSLSYVGVQKIDNVMLVGVENETGMFLMNAAANGENVWVMKKYDPTTDRIHWTLNSDTELSSIKFTVQGVTFNSASYVLPIVGNMDITLNSGTLEVSKNVCLLPGVSLNIAKEAKLYIPSGQTLYVVDKKQWYNVYGSTVDKETGEYTKQKYAWTPVYSPSWTNSTTSPRSALKTDNTNLPSAEIFVHGMIEVAGNLFTTAANTNGTDGGAWIHSTNEDAGKVFFASGWTAKITPSWYLYTQKNAYQEAKVTSAQLMNGDGSYTQTKGAAAGQSFNYINGEWVALTEGCLSTMTDGSGTHYYANPSDVVEVNDGNDDYTYSDVATGQRFFINTEGKTSDGSCAWWEVQQDANGWYASNETFANYGGYYAYDRGTSYWTPVTVDVIWTGDGMTSTSYPVHKGTSPVYLGASPTKNGYNWTGWRDGEGTFYDRNATLPIVMESTTYTAVFEENIKRYTVVFKDKNGGVLEAGLYDQGTIPTCNVEVPPILTEDKVYTFKGTWSPALAAVTKAADYTAQYTESIRMYPIHFLNADGTEIYVEDVAHGATPIYRGATPTRESNTAYSYEFNGEWQSSTGATGLAVVSGEEWYTAQFNAIEREYGDWLDVVDASASTLTLNMNGYFSPTAFGDWVISVGDNDYDKTHDAYKNGNRTIPVALPVGLKADDKVLIVAKGKNGVVESRRRYVIPHVYTGDATLDEMAADYSSVVFVQSGTLTVEKDVTLAAIYVAPGAALKINTGVTLAVDKLVLRTSATASASLTDGGRLLCKSVNYSRIVSDKSQAYPIALPFASDLSKVTMSNGKAAKVGTNFGLLYFDSQQRADGGFAESNWETVRIAEHLQMNAQQAYQLLSTSAYYSEYYFPVSYTPDAANATVAVGAYTGAAAEGHWGFNAVCSPYTKEYVCTYTDIAEAVKISVLNTDNKTYTQKTADKIAPATMFFYQAPSNGVLSFGSTFEFETSATRSIVARRTPQSVSPAQTQWIQLEYGAADGHVDETNIYLHPDKFTDTYDLGYDLQKLSTSGGLPFIWTSAAYGDLAFAALPDSVATQGIALSMYAPAAGEMMLNVVDNVWMSRLEALYLMDKQADVQVDLLHNDYTWAAEAGTSTGRFYLYPILRKPDAGDVVTDVPSLVETEAMVAYAIDRQVVVEHVQIGSTVRCYDATGKLVASCMAVSEQAVMAVPTSGVYLVHADNGMCKVMVNE